MPRETHFKEDWLLSQDSNKHLMSLWCKKGKNDFEVHCKICNHYFSCANRGKDQLIKHSETKKHYSKANVAFSARQTVFTVTESGSLATTSVLKESAVTLEDPMRAELIWAFKLAQSNFSFASCDGLHEVFTLMFGESAKNFNMDKTKASYLISFGLGPFLVKELIRDIRESNNFYTLCLDETTTTQVKYLYVRYWSPQQVAEPVQCRYLTSIFLGHAEAETMFDAIIKSSEIEGVSISKAIMVSMDGPNVNKSLFAKLDSQVKSLGSPGLVNIGPCSLHKVHNAFGSGLRDHPFSLIDEFATDIFTFFKLSAARREDYKKSQELMQVDEHYFCQYVNSRWLSIGPVLKRLIEQHEALKHYFFKFLPQTQSSKSLNKNDKYQRICSALKNNILLPLMQFLLHISAVFSKFLTMFQSEQPLVHVLYDEMNHLMKTLLRKCIKAEEIEKHKNNISHIEVKKSNLLEFKDLEVGSEAKKTLLSFKILDKEKSEFYQAVSSFFITVTNKLMKDLPIDNKILKNMQCLHGLARKEEKSYDMFKRIITQVPHGLTEEKIDRLKEEWLGYQSDLDVAEDWYIQSKTQAEVKYMRVDSYWNKVFQLKTSTGKPRYPQLASYLPSILTLAHGNADVERGFSMNNNIVTNERKALNEHTIIGLRVVKDFVRVNGKVENIKITKRMVDAGKGASSKYKEYLAQKKDQEVRKQKESAEQKEKEASKEKEITARNEIKAAENLLEEGKKKLQLAMKRKDFAEVSLASEMIDISTKRLKAANELLVQK